ANACIKHMVGKVELHVFVPEIVKLWPIYPVCNRPFCGLPHRKIRLSSRQNKPSVRVFRSAGGHVRFTAAAPCGRMTPRGKRMASPATATVPTAVPDLAAIKAKQQAAWSSGNY